MKNYDSKNSKVRWEYQNWLQDAEGLSESTILAKLRAIKLYEDLFPGEDFANFNSGKAKKFKERVANKTENGVSISPLTYKKYLINLKMFFEWLSMEPGYISKIDRNSLNYLKPSRKILATATGKRIIKYPSIEDVIKLINSVEGDTEVSNRNRAIIAFAFLTGMRVMAIVSLPLKCVDLDEMVVSQDPRQGVQTKFSKTIYSMIFNFDAGLLKCVVDWINYLKDKGFKPEDPVFPKSKQEMKGNNRLFETPINVVPEYWISTSSIRGIFKQYSIKANVKYYTPQSYRHSAMNYAFKYAQNGADYKAISQNFGHENIATTFSIYGQLDPADLIDRLKEITSKKSIQGKEITKEQVIEYIKKL